MLPYGAIELQAKKLLPKKKKKISSRGRKFVLHAQRLKHYFEKSIDKYKK